MLKTLLVSALYVETVANTRKNGQNPCLFSQYKLAYSYAILKTRKKSCTILSIQITLCAGHQKISVSM